MPPGDRSSKAPDPLRKSRPGALARIETLTAAAADLADAQPFARLVHHGEIAGSA
jgi:hypothetical protein